MTEKEMIASLERQTDLLRPTGFDLSSVDEFIFVGEWLLAFEWIYVGDRRHPNVLDPDEIHELEAYFGVDMSDLA